MTHRPPHSRGFTLTELLVVLALIAVLLALLLPALSGVRSSGLMTKSSANMKQVGTWIRLYAQDNRETIVPSQFDYSADAYPGKVRSVVTAGMGQPNQGTWSDILWTVFEPGVFPDGLSQLGNDYRYDSPDVELYKLLENDVKSPMRSAAINTRNFGPAPGSLPKPYGLGAYELGRPGYFAANQFFDSTGSDGEWYVTGQIRQPERSMYLIDSVAGEVIEDEELPFEIAQPGGGPVGGHVSVAAPGGSSTHEVDFRYVGSVCLMLFLDGHTEPVARFEDLTELRQNRQIRVQDLDRR